MKNIIGIWSHWLYSPYYSMHPLESLYLYFAFSRDGTRRQVERDPHKRQDGRRTLRHCRPHEDGPGSSEAHKELLQQEMM